MLSPSPHRDSSAGPGDRVSRFRHGLLRVLFLVPMLLCVAGWALSYRIGCTYHFRDWQHSRLVDRRWGLESARGGLCFWSHWYSWADLDPQAPLLQEPDVDESHWEIDPHPVGFLESLGRPSSGWRAAWRWLGFDVDQARWPTYGFHRVVVPYWFLAAILACGPGVRMLRRIRRRPRRMGLCAVCGYDLRAHHPGQKCPECGTPIQAGGGP